MLFPWEIFHFLRSGLPKPRYARVWQLSDLRKWKISRGKSNFGFEFFYFRGSLFQLLGTDIPSFTNLSNKCIHSAIYGVGKPHSGVRLGTTNAKKKSSLRRPKTLRTYAARRWCGVSVAFPCDTLDAHTFFNLVLSRSWTAEIVKT